MRKPGEPILIHGWAALIYADDLPLVMGRTLICLYNFSLNPFVNPPTIVRFSQDGQVCMLSSGSTTGPGPPVLFTPHDGRQWFGTCFGLPSSSPVICLANGSHSPSRVLTGRQCLNLAPAVVRESYLTHRQIVGSKR